MVAIKSHLADKFLGKPDPAISVILIYGTDVGLVGERARLAAKRWAGVETPPGEILRIGDTDLDEDRDKLSIELQMMPMFGGRKIVRTATSQRINAAMLKPLAERGDLPSILIIEAGNLKPTDALRKICEKAPHAAAIACFPDEERDLTAMIQDELKKTGLKITPDAEDLLVTRLGADRALSRNEVEKLALYCMDRDEITADDVEQIVGDASELALDRIVRATAAGDPAAATRELARATASGESPQGLILALQRYFIRIHRVRHDMDGGRNLADALRLLRPPLHFKQRDAFTAHLRLWTSAKANRALTAISDAATRARKQSAIESIHAERLILLLAQVARTPDRRN